MTLLTVDPQKCKHDGICVETCPMGIIQLNSKEALPTLIPGGDALCIQCGHCVAVCPAWGHEPQRHCRSTSVRPSARSCCSPTPRPNNFCACADPFGATKRRVVPRELLARLIEVARHAPTGHNSQPVEWLVIYDDPGGASPGRPGDRLDAPPGGRKVAAGHHAAHGSGHQKLGSGHRTDFPRMRPT